jgi:hypothetical protein
VTTILRKGFAVPANIMFDIGALNNRIGLTSDSMPSHPRIACHYFVCLHECKQIHCIRMFFSFKQIFDHMLRCIFEDAFICVEVTR